MKTTSELLETAKYCLPNPNLYDFDKYSVVVFDTEKVNYRIPCYNQNLSHRTYEHILFNGIYFKNISYERSIFKVLDFEKISITEGEKTIFQWDLIGIRR